jgi:serine/arginine repetitive matrix protein 1
MPDPKKMQVNLLGFMDKYGAAHFMETLWKLLISAQETVGGVPAEVRLSSSCSCYII